MFAFDWKRPFYASVARFTTHEMPPQADNDEARREKARQKIEIALGISFAETEFLPALGHQTWSINALEYLATLATAISKDGHDLDYLQRFITNSMTEQKANKISGQFLKTVWEKYQDAKGPTASRKRRAPSGGAAKKIMRSSLGQMSPCSPAESSGRFRSSVSPPLVFVPTVC